MLSFNNRVFKTGAIAIAVTIAFAFFVYGAADWIRGMRSDTATCSINGKPAPPEKIIPQIVLGSFDGSLTYITVIQIVNTSGAAEDVAANFYKEDGTPLDVMLTADKTTLSDGVLAPFSIPKDGVLVIAGGGTSMPGRIAWGRVTTCGTSSVSAFFETRDSTLKTVYSRVSVSVSPSNMSTFVIPRVRERSRGLDTAFAVVNTSSSGAAVLRAELMDASGSVIAAKDISMPAGSHQSLFVQKDLFPSLSEADGRTYQHLKFSSTSPTFAAAALAIEGGTLTSVPVEPN